MKVSLNWLNEYVNLDGIDPAELAEQLTHAGLEVDGIETVGARFSGVTVAKILTVEQHPNADRLNLVTVDTGSGHNKVVCGAPNVRPDAVIAYANVGATVLNRKEGSSFKLSPVTIRGVESTGMICSLDELGLTEQYTADEDGIWILNQVLETPELGQPLQGALALESDTILDTAPTANRGDWMSMLGVARDVAALLDRPLKTPAVFTGDLKPNAPMATSVALTDESVCSFYAGATLDGVRAKSSPAWMVKRLESAGVRAINLLVDITNYVMLEMGQPLHAFDLDYVLNGDAQATIGVRRARHEEPLTTLDDEEYRLTDTAVVITRNDNAVALAGVMGGASTRILDETTEIFLEAAVFPSATTRKSAKSVGIRTESSARFERGVDRENCEAAFRRAIELYQEFAGATLVATRCAELGQPVQPLTIDLDPAQVEAVLAQPVSADETQSILTKLGFDVAKGSGELLVVTIPSFRRMDVSRPIDLVEEVARIKGYDATEPVLPVHTQTVMLSPRHQFLRRMHQVMRGAGLNEASTNSLIGPNLLTKTGFTHDETLQVAVTNSHSPEHTLMRQSLLPNLLEIAQLNVAQGQADVAMYELGRTYLKRGKTNHKATGVVEKLMLGGLITGSIGSNDWSERSRLATTFYDVKGVMERLMQSVGFDGDVEYQPVEGDAHPHMHPGKTAVLVSHKKEWGMVGQLNPLYQEKLKLKQPVFLFELDADQFYKWLKQTNALASASVEHVLSPYQAVTRDMAFLASKTVTHAELVSAVQDLNEKNIITFNVFDQYEGANIASDQRSLAYRLTLQSQEKTLTDSHIEDLVAKVKYALSHQFSVQFR